MMANGMVMGGNNKAENKGIGYDYSSPGDLGAMNYTDVTYEMDEEEYKNSVYIVMPPDEIPEENYAFYMGSFSPYKLSMSSTDEATSMVCVIKKSGDRTITLDSVRIRLQNGSFLCMSVSAMFGVQAVPTQFYITQITEGA